MHRDLKVPNVECFFRRGCRGRLGLAATRSVVAATKAVEEATFQPQLPGHQLRLPVWWASLPCDSASKICYLRVWPRCEALSIDYLA
jgi:hypothetical protein